MDINKRCNLLSVFVFSLSLLVSTNLTARHGAGEHGGGFGGAGGHAGGFHNGGGPHNNEYHPGGWNNNNGIHNNNFNGGFIAVPIGGGYNGYNSYNNGTCETVTNCNFSGQCWTQQSCN